jgi:hypothetical protein
VRIRCRFPKSRISPKIASASIASPPDEPADELEADPIMSSPTHYGQLRGRCRFRKGRIWPSSDSASIVSGLEAPANESGADPITSHPTRRGPRADPATDPAGSDAAHPRVGKNRIQTEATICESQPDSIESHAAPAGQGRSRGRSRKAWVRPTIVSNRIRSHPAKHRYASEADRIQSPPTRPGSGKGRGRPAEPIASPLP